jgi:hypothetical protein
VAVLADGVCGLDVERDLDRPAVRFVLEIAGFFAFFLFLRGFSGFAAVAERFCGFEGRLALGERQVGGFTALVDLREAFVRGGAFRKTEFFAVGLQVFFRVQVVVCVDERDRLFGIGGCRFVRQPVRGVEILWREAEIAARQRRGRIGDRASDAEWVGVRAGGRGHREEL